MKLVGKTPFRFISCLYYSTEYGSVDNWHVLIHTQLDKTGTHDGRTHRAWPAIISLDSRVLNWGWIYTSNVRLSGAAQVLYMFFKDIILHAWWCICADQLVVIGGLVFRVACTNYLRCCGGPHLFTPKNWSANFLYWWGEFSTPGSTTCQHPQEVTANHNNKLATN